jgi:hypothetical protein
VVGGAVDELLLGGGDGGQNVGLAGVIAVGSDSEVDLLWVAVGLERLRNS